MLSLLLIIPILGSMLLIPVSEEGINNQSKMKKIALITSLMNFILSIYLWLQFDSSTSNIKYDSCTGSFIDYTTYTDE